MSLAVVMPMGLLVHPAKPLSPRYANLVGAFGLLWSEVAPIAVRHCLSLSALVAFSILMAFLSAQAASDPIQVVFLALHAAPKCSAQLNTCRLSTGGTAGGKRFATSAMAWQCASRACCCAALQLT